MEDKYRLIKVWSDDKADYEYILQWWWANGWFARLLEGVDGTWCNHARGGLYWAKQIAAHYHLEVPTEVHDGDTRV